MKTTIDDLNILWKKLGNDTGVDIVISKVEGYIRDIMKNSGELFGLNPKTRVLQKGEMYPD